LAFALLVLRSCLSPPVANAHHAKAKDAQHSQQRPYTSYKYHPQWGVFNVFFFVGHGLFPSFKISNALIMIS